MARIYGTTPECSWCSIDPCRGSDSQRVRLLQFSLIYHINLENCDRHCSSVNWLNARPKTSLIELYLRHFTAKRQAGLQHPTTGSLKARLLRWRSYDLQRITKSCRTERRTNIWSTRSLPKSETWKRLKHLDSTRKQWLNREEKKTIDSLQRKRRMTPC